MKERRRVVPELMDDPALDTAEHERALDGLGRVNAIGRTAATVWRQMRALAPANARRPLRILDVATGGGHVAVGLARAAARAGVRLEVCGCDRSAVAVAYARRLAARAGVSGVDFRQIDVLQQALPPGFDVVCSSLFLHHLSDDAAVRMLRRMGDAAVHGVVLSDLRRTRLGAVFASVGTRLLSRSRVMHVDAARSVDAAFTTMEIRQLAAQAGLGAADVINVWPQRFLLTWRAW